jgi:hypothetical protein
MSLPRCAVHGFHIFEILSNFLSNSSEVTSSHGYRVFSLYALAMFHNNTEINRNKLKATLFFL